MENKIFTKDEIIDKVVDLFVQQLGIQDSEVPTDVNFYQEYAMDSLDCIEILMEIESEYHISIPDDKAKEVCTLDQIVDLVAETLEGSGCKVA